MGRKKDIHSAEHEPALSMEHWVNDPDPSEAKAHHTLSRSAARDAKEAYQHSVHDELAHFPEDLDRPTVIDRDFSCENCGYNLRGMTLGQPCPECNYAQYERPSRTDREGYANWLASKLGQTSVSKTWVVTFVVVFVSGLWSVFGAFWGGSGDNGAFFAVTVWGPAVEEVMKIALIAVIIERAPYLFSSKAQILIAAAGAGLMFSIIENFLYLFVYITDPPTWLIIWRWTVCVALHVGCTLIAGFGAMLVWNKQITQLRRFPVPVDMRFLVAAILVHGIYNGTVTLLELSGGMF